MPALAKVFVCLCTLLWLASACGEGAKLHNHLPEPDANDPELDTPPPDATDLHQDAELLDIETRDALDATDDGDAVDLADAETLDTVPDTDPLDASDLTDVDPDPCPGECRVQTLTATFGAVTEPFERAIFGLTAPTQAEQPWELYVEAMHGGFSGCPRSSSPLPDRILILSGITLPTDLTPQTKSDGVAAVLLDSLGTLAPAMQFTHASAVVVTPVAWAVCTECFGQPAPSDPEAFIAFSVEATFPTGRIAGHLYGRHCDIMNE